MVCYIILAFLMLVVMVVVVVYSSLFVTHGLQYISLRLGEECHGDG